MGKNPLKYKGSMVKKTLEAEEQKFTPKVKVDNNLLLTTRSFSIIRNEKLNYLYLLTIHIPHDGELNPKNLTNDNTSVVSIEFKKHTETYRGSWLNYAVKWEENEEPLLILYFTCTRVE
jgi:hypothetical protein